MRLTRHLKSRNVKQAVTTSSDRHFFEIKTTRHREWFSKFDCLVSCDDPAMKQGKPAPDIFLVAAIRMHARPEECLVFEDAPAGVTAARTAGMYPISVPDPNMDHAAYPDAHQVLRSLEDFEPASWGLPPFDNNNGDIG